MPKDPHRMAAFYNVTVSGVDVTNAITIHGVTMEDQEDMLRTLTFTLKNAYFLMNRISRGMPVKFTGGSQDSRNQKNSFSGKVKQIAVNFPDNGSAEFTVVAWGEAYKGAKRVLHTVYPSPDSVRTWARKQEMKLQDIVDGILRESFPNNEHIIDIPDKYNVTYTHKHPFTQKCTDWMALRMLATQAGCLLLETATKNNSSEHTIIFADRSKYANEEVTDSDKNAISFEYVQRGPDSKLSTSFAGVQSVEEGTDENFQTRSLRPGAILMENLNFSQNLDTNSGSLRIVSAFDETAPEGSQSKLYLQQLKEGGSTEEDDTYVNYELRPSNDPIFQQNDGWESLRERLGSDPNSVDMNEVLPFFKLVPPTAQGYDKTTDGMQGAGPLATRGYELSCDVIGDVDIIPFRNYPIYGLGKYSTSPDGKHKFYLRSITHSFSDNGFIQSLSFYQ